MRVFLFAFVYEKRSVCVCFIEKIKITVAGWSICDIFSFAILLPKQ